MHIVNGPMFCWLFPISDDKDVRHLVSRTESGPKMTGTQIDSSMELKTLTDLAHVVDMPSDVAACANLISTLEWAHDDLQEVLRGPEREIGTVANCFRGLAGYADEISNLAAGIVHSVESENIASPALVQFRH